MRALEGAAGRAALGDAALARGRLAEGDPCGVCDDRLVLARMGNHTAPIPAASRVARQARGAPLRASDRVLALQRRAGNSAVCRLLRQPVATAAPATATASPERASFDRRMRERWGVSVRTGTEADQLAEMRRMTPSADPSPSSIVGWQTWDPAADRTVYDDILGGFEAIGVALGGIPDVGEVRFLAVGYENVGGVAQARPNEGAYYSGGLLTIYRRFETASWPLPDRRSTANAPASLSAGSRSDSRRRIIVHELAHGVFERFATPGRSGSEPGFSAAWAQAAGWRGGRLEQGGIALTRTNWNQAWPEQPVSEYALRDPGEDFAESLTCYIERPRVLAERSPARHAFIAARVAGWRASLRAPAYPPGDYPLPPAGIRYA